MRNKIKSALFGFSWKNTGFTPWDRKKHPTGFIPLDRNDHPTGFTLIEILLVIGVLALLAAIVIIAINPARQLAQVRNTNRQSDITHILNGVYQYSIDHNGNLPAGIDYNLKMIGTSPTGCTVSCVKKLAESPAGYSIAKLRISDFFGYTFAAQAAGTGWVSPTGASDPSGQWSNLANAYDSNVVTYATDANPGGGWSSFITFDFATPIVSDRLRVNTDYADAHIAAVQIDVLLDGVWTTVFNGGNEAAWNCQFVTVNFTKGSVSQARFRYNYKVGGYSYWLYEFQLYRTAASTLPPSCSTLPASVVQQNSVVLHGNIIDDGGEPVDWHFQYGLTAAYGSETGWNSGAASGDVFTQLVTGLNGSTSYHYRAQARNSAGTTDCSDQIVTTKEADVGWILPLSSSDPDNKWENPAFAYDDNAVSFARSYHNFTDQAWSSYLYFSFNPTMADKVRIIGRANSEVNAVGIEVFKDGVWSIAYQGPFADQQWAEFSFTEGTVNQVRVRFQAATANGFYWQLNEVNLEKAMEMTEGACLDLAPFLAPDFLSLMPADPQGGTPEKTFYAIKRSLNNRISVYACQAELDQDLIVTR